jgi:hypothetical protein
MKLKHFFVAALAASFTLLPTIAQAAEASSWWWWWRKPPVSIPELSLGGAASGLALAIGALLVLSSRRRRCQ